MNAATGGPPLLLLSVVVAACLADHGAPDVGLYRHFLSNPAQKVPFKVLRLDKDEDCGDQEHRSTCTKAKDCVYLEESIRTDHYLDICSYEGVEPIVCCPEDAPDWYAAEPPARPVQQPIRKPAVGKPTERPRPVTENRSKIATEKCRRYIKLNFPKVDHTVPAVVGGTETVPQEFPHMAAIGYGETTEERTDWRCGGSLINERWILTAAHCTINGPDTVARWVRLGDYNINSDADTARPRDYAIVEQVVHPEYKSTGRYNDIALFRLDSDVEFSSFVRPVCLNTVSTPDPTAQIATGWGTTGQAESGSDILLKLTLDIVKTDDCNRSYLNTVDGKLKLGILAESMICAGSYRDNEDTCAGDSGGPLQVINTENPDMYTIYGITSFGSPHCNDKNTPGVYTRVSYYVPWIESIVWPDGN